VGGQDDDGAELRDRRSSQHNQGSESELVEDEWRELANRGHTDAQYALGVLLEEDDDSKREYRGCMTSHLNLTEILSSLSPCRLR
jgi:hypothetical protein